MNLSDLEFAWALCPHCAKKFNLEEAEPTFSIGRKGAAYPDVFILCRQCHSEFRSATHDGHLKIANACIGTLNETARCGAEISLYGITTALDLILNEGDLVTAIEFGCGLPQTVFEKIYRGEITGTMLPGGLLVTVSDSPIGGSHV